MVKKIRKDKNITQRELAAMLGIERSTVSKWEKGISIPRGKTLIKLAEILECTVDELLIKEGKRPKEDDSSDT